MGKARRTKKAKITSRFGFPIDMLRYDSCWPATEQDAAAITKGFRSSYGVSAVVEMDAAREWAVGRWKSFGCTLEEVG